MSDSDDSDYNVEDFVTPDTIRRTYNNEDLLSDDADESDSSKSESEGNSDSEAKNQQCKLKNGDNQEEANEEDKPVSTMRSRPSEEPRTNSRFILYCTNLSATTTRSMLEDFFADAGQVKSIRIPKVRLGNFAFVEMKDVDGFKVRLFLIFSTDNLSELSILGGLEIQQQRAWRAENSSLSWVEEQEAHVKQIERSQTKGTADQPE